MGSGPEQIYARVFRTLKPRTPVPEIRVEIRRYANASAQVLLAGGVLRVRMADTLADAPETVQEALAEILLAKLFRRPVSRDSRDRYRRYLNRKDVRRSLDQARALRGRKLFDPPSGRHYDLIEVFEAMNFRYFFGLMARPALGWSRKPSRTLLGHYDSSHHAIVLSRLLDSPEVPRLVVEYVMFHEMLHLRHPEQHDGGRRCVHTAAFKEEEKRFEHLREAKAWLRGLA